MTVFQQSVRSDAVPGCLLWFCDELWLFGDTVTEGMVAELQFCKYLNIRIRRIQQNEIQKVLGGNA